MRVLIVLCALVAGALAGCASVPMASIEADSGAKQFLPKKGYSNIYLYRNETFGAAVAMTVSLDGKVMGRTGPQTYFLWEVVPGKHEIASHTENTSRITIDAKEGRNHYVWQEVKMGNVAARLAVAGDARGGGQKGRAGVQTRHRRGLGVEA